MLSKTELLQLFRQLNLTQTEAAQLLGVDPRTVRRWVEGAEIPGPAEQALRAWSRLNDHNLPWRPDSVAVVNDDLEAIATQRAEAIGIEALLERVEQRGGPIFPCDVDMEKCRATFGPHELTYQMSSGGRFAPSAYIRKDTAPDTERDKTFIEDAIFCIAQAIRKSPDFGPVTLVLNGAFLVQPNGSYRIYPPEEHPTNQAAMRRAFELAENLDITQFVIREYAPAQAGKMLLSGKELAAEHKKRR